MYTAAQLELPEQLEMADVVSEANRLLKLVPDLADSGEFSERTIHYYVHQRLLPRRTGRGPGTTYAPGFVYRLLFIRLLQRSCISLGDIRDRYRVDDVSHLPDDIIVNILRGKAPLWSASAEVLESSPSVMESEPRLAASVLDEDVVAPRRTKRASASDRRAWLQRRPKPDQRDEQASPPPGAKLERQIEHTALEMPRAQEDASFEMMPTGEAGPVSYALGPDAELVLHKELTPSQQRRIEHIIELMKDILDDAE